MHLFKTVRVNTQIDEKRRIHKRSLMPLTLNLLLTRSKKIVAHYISSSSSSQFFFPRPFFSPSPLYSSALCRQLLLLQQSWLLFDVWGKSIVKNQLDDYCFLVRFCYTFSLGFSSSSSVLPLKVTIEQQHRRKKSISRVKDRSLVSIETSFLDFSVLVCCLPVASADKFANFKIV